MVNATKVTYKLYCQEESANSQHNILKMCIFMQCM